MTSDHDGAGRAIWTHPPDIASVNAIHEHTACAQLGIRINEVGDDYLRGTMPVDARTVQPFGLLHGGASAVLAETLGSVASYHCVNHATHRIVGTQITANHLRGVTQGMVTGTARPVHIGRTSHLWEISIVDERGKLACSARLTTAVVAVQPG